MVGGCGLGDAEAVVGGGRAPATAAIGLGHGTRDLDWLVRVFFGRGSGGKESQLALHNIVAFGFKWPW